MKTDIQLPVTPVQTGDCITILARRWFDKSGGNSYFVANVYINNTWIVTLPFQYGYGDHYIDQAFKKLEELGYTADVKHYNNGSSEPFWQYCQRKGVNKLTNVTDVQRKKDL